MALVDTYFPNNYFKFNYLPNDISDDETNYKVPNLKLKVDIHNISLQNIMFDSVKYPENMVNILKNHFKSNINYFVPNFMYNTFMDKNQTLDLIRSKLMTRLYRLFLSENLIKLFINEIYEFIGSSDINKSLFDINDFKDQIIIDKNYQVLFDNHLNILIITNYLNISIIDNLVIVSNIMDQNKFAIFSYDKNYISFGNNSNAQFTVKVNDNITKLQGYILSSNKNQDINIVYDYITGEITNKYYYYNNNSKLKVLATSIYKSNGDFIEYYNKNGLLVNRKYQYNTNTHHLISYCMMNDPNNSTIRYRGKYEEKRIGNKISSKELTQNDQIIYKKENESVIINDINNIKIKDDIIIGWKVAKSINGENRIIKLMIPIDAKIIKPIDQEYFHTKGKERCDKAIVMDIQLPDEGEEISVVPHEMLAYSSIHITNTPFEYKVGKEIIPDLFDENEDTSCTNGIHFYRNRHSVFDVYINRQ